LSKLLYVVFFVFGFITAAHWDKGVDVIKELSPFAEKTLLQKAKKAVGQDLGSKMKRAFEEKKKEFQSDKK
jgi:hypothetical protein